MSKLQSIALVGFMGTGKSTVGRHVARMLAIPFVDLDDAIESLRGVPIPEIFAREGEAAFRDYEHEALTGVLRGEPCILATGGGVVIDARNRALLKDDCFAVCLNLSVDTILRRVSTDGSRPLLATEDPRRRVCELMQQRAPLYAEIPHQIDREGLNPKATAREVVRLWRESPCS